jgi:hypothetical protein
LLTASVIVGLVVAALAVLVAASQRDPGDGVWDLSKQNTFTGILLNGPYPMLCMTDPSSGSQRMVLLVGDGKYGVAERVGALGGKAVTVRGNLVQRDAWTMLSIDEADADAIAAAEGRGSRGEPPRSVSVGSVSLRGQIIDPKCFLGAMKPGDGKTHKACATLCIRGGIPPAFFTLDASGSPVYYLLVDAAGAALAGDSLAAVLPFVADDIDLAGQVESIADLKVLRLDESSLRRH